jgi:hypothetical protein
MENQMERKPGYYKHPTFGPCELDVYQDNGVWFFGKGADCGPLPERMWEGLVWVRPFDGQVRIEIPNDF